MLDIKKIIENKQIYIEGLSNRGYDVTNLDVVISLNENRGKLITDGDKKRAQRNEISKALPIYKIPSLIFRFLLNFSKLKKELKSYSN